MNLQIFFFLLGCLSSVKSQILIDENEDDLEVLRNPIVIESPWLTYTVH